MITLQSFAGMRPITHAHNLPDACATHAQDVWLWSSGLDALRGIKPIRTGFNLAVRLFKAGSKLIQMREWADFVRSPIVQDKHERIYWTKDTDGLQVGKWSELVDNVQGASLATMSWPSAAPSVVVTTQWTDENAVTLKDTSFLITYLTVRDEETAPSLASSTVTYADGVDKVVVSWNAPASDVAKVIVYMAVDGVWIAIKEVPASQTSVTFDPLDDDIAPVVDTVVGSELSTSLYARSPSDLRGLVRLINGSLAGFTLDGEGKVTSTVHISVPYIPHAWPLAYRFKIDAEVVALASVPEGLLVLTKGNPVLIAGASPDVMDEYTLESYQSCLDRRSVVYAGDAVLWAAPDGIAVYGGRSVKIISDQVWSREQWQALNPSNMLMGLYENQLVIYPQSQTMGYLYSLQRHDVVKLSQGQAKTLLYDVEEDALLVVRGDELGRFAAGEYLVGEWVSKSFIVPAARTYSSARLIVDGTVQLNLYRADNEIHHSDATSVPYWSKLVDSQQPFRVGSAERKRDIRIGFKLTDKQRVRLCEVAQDMRELV